MSLEEHLRRGIELAGKNTADHCLCCSLTVGQARKLLALFKAAKDFHQWSDGGDDDSYYSCKDTLLNAIHAVEGKP